MNNNLKYFLEEHSFKLHTFDILLNKDMKSIFYFFNLLKIWLSVCLYVCWFGTSVLLIFYHSLFYGKLIFLSESFLYSVSVLLFRPNWYQKISVSQLVCKSLFIDFRDRGWLHVKLTPAPDTANLLLPIDLVVTLKLGV